MVNLFFIPLLPVRVIVLLLVAPLISCTETSVELSKCSSSNCSILDTVSLDSNSIPADTAFWFWSTEGLMISVGSGVFLYDNPPFR